MVLRRGGGGVVLLWPLRTRDSGRRGGGGRQSGLVRNEKKTIDFVARILWNWPRAPPTKAHRPIGVDAAVG